MVETNKRRTDRVLIGLPVLVSGTDAAGKQFSEDTTTVTVSQHGAAIALKTALLTGQKIVLERQRSQFPRVATCEVKEQGGRHSGLLMVSLAFQNPTIGFWDIYFPPLPSQDGTTGRALLGCDSCGKREIVHLDTEQLAQYHTQRTVLRKCGNCRKATMWREWQHGSPKPMASAPPKPIRLAPDASTPAHDQRKHRRLAAEVPVCIRQPGAEDDLTMTEDISHGGLRFSSRRQYSTGAYVQVAIPYSSGGANIFVDARITHSSGEPTLGLYRFGIVYVAENHPSANVTEVTRKPDGLKFRSSAA